MLCDFHIHTGFSYDSDADADEVLAAAIDKNMEYMAITDHHDFDLDGGVFEQKDPAAYYNEYLAYRERYQDRIKLSVGIELGLDAAQGRRLYDFAGKFPFDFIIASVHGVDGYDPYYDDYWQGITAAEGMCRYFDAILAGLEVFDDFDVLGHIDYALRYVREPENRRYSYEQYGRKLDAILKKVIAMGKGIEINTAGIRAGLGTTNPAEEVIKHYREYGGRIITVGSDAHTPSDVGADFETAGKILKRCGFDEYCVFVGRKPVFLPV